ncbi:MAG: hypothetical protein Q9168_003267 [Polycauliona sp. 1 TL-2023]
MQTITDVSDRAAERIAHVLARALEQDPPGHYFLLSHHRRRDWKQISFNEQVAWFRGLLSQAFEEGAEIVTTSDRSIAAVWYPPHPPGTGDDGDEASNGLGSGGLQEFLTLANDAKSRCLYGREYWYLFLLGRDPQADRTCSASELVRPFLEKARGTKIPVWLEATTLHAKQVYEHLGFTVAEELVIGRGRSDRWGNSVDGGDGIPVWAMVFER